jgi:diguanylate cyclase (GGDEF)-like protein
MKKNAILESLDMMPKFVMTLFGVLLTLVIGYLDWITGTEISLSFFYVLPVMLIAWFEGGTAAAAIALFCTVIWLAADLLSGLVYSNFAVAFWNGIMRMGIFLIVAYSFSTIKKLLKRESEQARIDYLTRVSNARYFYEQAEKEISRAARYNRPLAIAYLDIDNFKQVNDRFGHDAGDALLQAVAETMRSTLRLTDIISRLGGDEFAILLPETEIGQVTATIEKVHHNLMDAVKKGGWPVTFSTGVVTCTGPTCPAGELMKIADGLMYKAKKGGKNTIEVQQYDTPAASPAREPGTGRTAGA